MKKKPTAAQDLIRRVQGEDAKDLLDLRAAVKRNAGKPGISWEAAKKKLRLEKNPR
jgi:hypothetical protein